MLSFVSVVSKVRCKSETDMDPLKNIIISNTEGERNQTFN